MTSFSVSVHCTEERKPNTWVNWKHWRGPNFRPTSITFKKLNNKVF